MERTSPHALAAFAESLDASLAEGEPGHASVRRLAKALARTAERYGLSDLAEHAKSVAAASDEDLEREAARLVALLREDSEAVQGHVEILLVEDNVTVAELVRALVATSDRRVHVAASAAEAEKILEERPIRLLILDLILPDRDGRELLMQVRDSRRLSGLPVVVLSALESAAAENECALLGADEYILKPPDPKPFRAAVARLLMEQRPASGGGTSPLEGGDEVAEPDGTPRILVLEDDEVTAALIEHRLGREGFDIALYDDGSDLMRAVEAEDFDLILLDVKVPGMDGFEVLERIREMPGRGATPIMMLTGMGRESDVIRGLELGANDYMLKPFSPTELMARVRRQLLHAQHD